MPTKKLPRYKLQFYTQVVTLLIDLRLAKSKESNRQF